jgi:hypothetical protein
VLDIIDALCNHEDKDRTVALHVLSNLSISTLYSFGTVLRATDGTIKLTTKKENKDFIRNVSSTFWETGSTVVRLRAGRPGVRVQARIQKRTGRSLEPNILLFN